MLYSQPLGCAEFHRGIRLPLVRLLHHVYILDAETVAGAQDGAGVVGLVDILNDHREIPGTTRKNGMHALQATGSNQFRKERYLLFAPGGIHCESFTMPPVNWQVRRIRRLTIHAASRTQTDVKQIDEITIDSLDSRGRGRAHVAGNGLPADAAGTDGQPANGSAGRPVAVSWALPGDVVDVRVTRRRGGLIQSSVTAFRSRAVPRRTPACRHFDLCGGCTIQDLAYDRQLEIKEAMVRAAFLENGVALPELTRPILPAPAEFHYRNKLEYSFGAERWLTDEEIASGEEITERRALGFHAPGRFDRVIPITECHLQPEPSNRIRNALDRYARSNDLTYYHAKGHRGLLRLLIVRTSLDGEVMVTVMFGEDDPPAATGVMEFLAETFPEITSLNYTINTSANDSIFAHEIRNDGGSPFITERCHNLSLRIRPKAFYQTNPAQAERLYALVAERLEPRPEDLLLDLFSGIGSIGMYLSARVSRVVGIESVSDAVAAARENAELNGIDNVSFVEGLVEEALPGVIAQYGKPRVMVIDPPRAGIHPSVLPVLRKSGAERIVYVSCNPRTQAHDIGELSDCYKLTDLQPVDMFPQTRHVESVAVLEWRD